jgi:hypothetical protein
MDEDDLPRPINSDIVKSIMPDVLWLLINRNWSLAKNSLVYFSFFLKTLHDLISLKNLFSCFHQGFYEIKVFTINAEVKLLFVFNKRVLEIQVIS